MIVPDLNLPVYSVASDIPQHQVARRWWQECLNGDEAVGLLTWSASGSSV